LGDILTKLGVFTKRLVTLATDEVLLFKTLDPLIHESGDILGSPQPDVSGNRVHDVDGILRSILQNSTSA
jgi:hypothetical protein